MTQAIIIYGDPVLGFQFIGPFESTAHAAKHANTDADLDESWWIADLEEPVIPEDTPEGIFELRLCEQDNAVLKPGVTYRFTVDPHCRACRQLAAQCEPFPYTSE